MLLEPSTYNGPGNWSVLAVVALPGIKNLHALKTLTSSTPAASTIIFIIINCLRRHLIS